MEKKKDDNYFNVKYQEVYVCFCIFTAYIYIYLKYGNIWLLKVPWKAQLKHSPASFYIYKTKKAALFSHSKVKFILITVLQWLVWQWKKMHESVAISVVIYPSKWVALAGGCWLGVPQTGSVALVKKAEDRTRVAFGDVRTCLNAVPICNSCTVLQGLSRCDLLCACGAVQYSCAAFLSHQSLMPSVTQ